jgi:hypothetical protein
MNLPVDYLSFTPEQKVIVSGDEQNTRLAQPPQACSPRRRLFALNPWGDQPILNAPPLKR